MKQLTFFFILFLFGSFASANSIQLNCFYINLKNEKKELRINLDTSTQNASATELRGTTRVLTGKLTSDGQYYWFTGGEVIGAVDFRERYQINRHDLTFQLYLHLSRGTFNGECKMNETNMPKI